MGGVAIGLGVLCWRLIRWWPGTKRLKTKGIAYLQLLLPFAYAWCYGMLAILCVGGLIGAAADAVLWGSNWLGEAAFVWGIGGEYRYSTTRPATSALTVGGSLIFLIMTFCYFALLKKSENTRKDMLYGAWSGICLGLSKGIAGAAAIPLASLVNVAGAWLSTEVIV